MKMTAAQYRKFQQESKGKLNRLEKSRSGSKLSNKSVFYNGDKYDSVGEKEYAIVLDFQKKAGDIKDWQRQVKIDLKTNGKHITSYFIDFIVEHLDGTKELVEYKGFRTYHWQIKYRLLEAQLQDIYPGAKLTLINHQSKYKPKSTWKKQGKKI
jgi:hypothetical protein